MQPRKWKAKRRPGRPKTTGNNELISIRWPAWLVEGIERYMKEEDLPRNVALRRIVTRFLAERDMVEVPDEAQNAA